MKASFGDDPLIADNLSQLGPGWRLAVPDTTCTDVPKGLWPSGLSCQDFIQDTRCVGDFTRTMLIWCRASCRRLYDGLEFDDLPEDIQKYGGLDDYIEDAFGLRIPVCSLAEGFTVRTVQ